MSINKSSEILLSKKPLVERRDFHFHIEDLALCNQVFFKKLDFFLQIQKRNIYR